MKTENLSKQIVNLLLSNDLTVSEAEDVLYRAGDIINRKAYSPLYNETKKKPLREIIGSSEL